MTREVTTRPVDTPISGAERAYARATTRIQVATAVWELWSKLQSDLEIDQQWLANRLGKDKSRVSRLLKGPGNWTLDTVADLLEAMGGRLTLVEAHTYDDIARGEVRKRQHRSAVLRVVTTIEAEVLIDDTKISAGHSLNIPAFFGEISHIDNRPVIEEVEVT